MDFQKFEFISFGLYYYHEKKFNILNGFQDNANPTVLKGDNKFLCNNCKKLQDAKTECKIFEPPLKLLINLDYGKNKKYQPSKIEFDEEIDITKFVEFDYKQKIRYRIIGVCTHYGHSGSYGHYVAFCMVIMSLFVEILKLIPGMNLMIHFALNAIKRKFIEAVLIYYYMKEYLINIFNFRFILV